MFNINNFLDRYINIPYKVYRRKNFYMIKYYTPQARKITFCKSYIYNDLILLSYSKQIYIMKQIYIIHINDLKPTILNIIGKEVTLIDYKIPIQNIYNFFKIENDIFIYKKVDRTMGFLPLLDKYFIVFELLLDDHQINKDCIINISNGIIICNYIIICKKKYNIVLFNESRFNDIKKCYNFEFEEYFQLHKIFNYDECFTIVL